MKPVQVKNKPVSDPSQHSARQSSWITMALIMVTCLFLWSSLGLGRISASIPQVILSLTLVLLLLQLVKDLLGRSQDIAPTTIQDRTDNNSVLPALTWIGTMLLAVWLSGVSMGLALFCFLYLRWYANERWRISFAFAFGLGLGVQLLFGSVLKVALYKGILWPILA